MSSKYQLEIDNLAKVGRFLSDSEINSIMHELALDYAKETGATYTRSCLLLVRMLNTIKQELAVANSYTA